MSHQPILCLNCFHQIDANNVYFLCPNLCQSCVLTKNKPDDPRFFRLSFWERITSYFSETTTKAMCPCNRKDPSAYLSYSIDRYCPKCFAPLHKEAGLMPETLIALVGTPGSGKTEYLRSLEYTLMQQVSLRRVLFNREMGNARRNYSKEVRPTAAGFQYPPQVYYLNIAGDTGQESKGTARKKCLLVCFDPSGTDWQQIPRSSLRFLPHCAGLVVLCDPLTNPKILQLLLDQLAPSHFLYPKLKAQLEAIHGQPNPLKAILDEIIAFLNAMRKAIPIALVVSKSDLIRHPLVFPRDSLVHIDHHNPFEIDDLISDTVAEYMNRFEPGIHGLLQNWRTNEHWIGYFATSALGQAYSEGEIEYRRPIRILDPYFWILQRLGLL